MAGQISVGMERGIFRSVSNSGTILAEMRNIDDRFDASYLTSFTVERFNCFLSFRIVYFFPQEVEFSPIDRLSGRMLHIFIPFEYFIHETNNSREECRKIVIT